MNETKQKVLDISRRFTSEMVAVLSADKPASPGLGIFRSN